MGAAFRITILSIFLTTAVSCSARRFAERDRILDGEPVTQAEAQQLYSAASARSREIHSLRVLSKTTITSGEDKYRFDHVIVAQYPSSLRVETLAPNAGYAVSVLTTDGNSALITDAVEKKASMTDNPAGALVSRFKVQATPLELNYLLAGRVWPELLEEISNNTARLKKVAGTDSCSYISYTRRFEVALDCVSGLVNYARKFSPWNDEVMFVVELSSYGLKQEALLPDTINFQLMREDVQVELKLLKVKLNTDIPAALFTQQIPSNFVVVKDSEREG
ncbi:MAG: hypothetical protein DCC75_06510 [Proteobacteria bacterium]|nr:MAG: hypothetical protein DCC75_06510 [Pseudomonadota bacterium]